MIIGIDARPLAQKTLTGTSEYTLRILRALLEIDQENEYRLFFNSFSKIDLPEFTNQNIKIVSSKIPNKFFNLPLQKILKFPKINKKLQSDIFWQPNIGFLALEKKSKKVLTIHDLSFLRYPHFFSAKMRLWHSLVNVRRQVELADKIIAVSQSTKNDLIELLGVSESKINMIHSGISGEIHSITKDEAGEVLKKYDLPEKYIFSLSTLEPRKNIDGIIKAFDQYVKKTGDRSHHLIISGTRGWKFASIFKEYNQAKNQDLIKFIGYIKESEKKALYSCAQVFVYASYYEGFGFPPLEALSCECPVIISANSSLAEVCGEYATMVRADRISELSKAMEFCLLKGQNNKPQKEIVLKIREQYDWQIAAQKHLRLFQSLK